MDGVPSILTASEPLHETVPVVELRHAGISFDGPPVLVDVSFKVAPGETRILLGPAGVGKSVLLKLINGLLLPDTGSVLLFGEEINLMTEEQLFPLRAHTGMVFQEGALFDSLTVRDNIAYQLMQDDKITDEEIDTRVHEALRFVGLEQTFSMFPASLSGGMRRRVAIARAIITKPEVLLYDSPTGGLDPITSTNIIELIIKQRDVYKTSALLVTHRLQDAFVMATHCFDRASGHMRPIPAGSKAEVPMSFLILRDGKVIFDGDAGAIAKTQDQYIKKYLS